MKAIVVTDQAAGTAGMKLAEANELVKGLLKKYESKLGAPPLGKSLYECWDGEARKPTKEYRAIIKRYKSGMADLGVDLRPES